MPLVILCRLVLGTCQHISHSYRVNTASYYSVQNGQGIEPFIRIWRLYFAYCEAGFDEGRIGVSQFLLQRG